MLDSIPVNILKITSQKMSQNKYIIGISYRALKIPLEETRQGIARFEK